MNKKQKEAKAKYMVEYMAKQKAKKLEIREQRKIYKENHRIRQMTQKLNEKQEVEADSEKESRLKSEDYEQG